MVEALYPRATGTFFQREIDGLTAQGLDIHVFVLLPYDVTAWQDPAVLALTGGQAPDRSRVHYGGFFWSGELWRANLRALLRKPRRYLGTLATLLCHLSLRPLVSLKMLLLFPKAVYFAAEADRLGIEHLCAFWASHCATTAFVMAALMDRPVSFSTYAHAGGDLYKDQTFLRHKLRMAAAVFPNCNFNRNWLVERYPEVGPKLCLHDIGLDLEQYEYDPTPRRGATVVAVGKLIPEKGFHVLVEACALLRQRGVPIRCEILGEGPARADLAARVRRHGLEDAVFLLGQQAQPEVMRRMRTARLLVHPSVGPGDAVPTVIKEAAALGTPVIGTQVAGIPELIVDEETGLLVPEGDAAALAAAMERLLGDPELAVRMAAAGRAHVERTLDIGELTRRMAEHLRDLIACHSPSCSAESVPVLMPPLCPDPAVLPRDEGGVSVPNA